MKVLYGVQATGNGHITRARVMAPALRAAGIDVDFVFSGREPEKLFNMEPFGDYRCYQGMTLHMEGSRVNKWKTLIGNNPVRLLRDIFKLDLSEYDLVITDFEPVTAWAAKVKGVPSVGIAHQYAFLHRLPDSKTGFFLKNQIRLFAPAKLAVGLHWDHFEQPICPPLIQPPLYSPSTVERKIVVYLPHDAPEGLAKTLGAYSDFEFHIYAAVDEPHVQNNIFIKPFSREGFHKDLASCAGVICNSGFGLLSEAVQYGKKVLTLPQKGQVEQESNAEVLESLGLGVVIYDLASDKVATWLELPSPLPKRYPDLAAMLAAWIADGCKESVSDLADTVWQSEEFVNTQTA